MPARQPLSLKDPNNLVSTPTLHHARHREDAKRISFPQVRPFLSKKRSSRRSHSFAVHEDQLVTGAGVHLPTLESSRTTTDPPKSFLNQTSSEIDPSTLDSFNGDTPRSTSAVDVVLQSLQDELPDLLRNFAQHAAHFIIDTKVSLSSTIASRNAHIQLEPSVRLNDKRLFKMLDPQVWLTGDIMRTFVSDALSGLRERISGIKSPKYASLGSTSHVSVLLCGNETSRST